MAICALSEPSADSHSIIIGAKATDVAAIVALVAKSATVAAVRRLLAVVVTVAIAGRAIVSIAIRLGVLSETSSSMSVTRT